MDFLILLRCFVLLVVQAIRLLYVYYEGLEARTGPAPESSGETARDRVTVAHAAKLHRIRTMELKRRAVRLQWKKAELVRESERLKQKEEDIQARREKVAERERILGSSMEETKKKEEGLRECARILHGARETIKRKAHKLEKKEQDLQTKAAAIAQREQCIDQQIAETREMEEALQKKEKEFQRQQEEHKQRLRVQEIEEAGVDHKTYETNRKFEHLKAQEAKWQNFDAKVAQFETDVLAQQQVVNDRWSGVSSFRQQIYELKAEVDAKERELEALQRREMAVGSTPSNN